MDISRATDLHYRTQVLSSGNFELGGRVFTADQIVRVLEPLLTPQRREKIAKVIAQRTSNVAVVTENLYDVGNISAVMRSAESFGFLPFHIIERADAKYKKSDRISRGTEKWLDIRRHKTPEACFVQLRAQGFKIYATDLDATIGIDQIDFSQKSAVIFGNEHAGISDFVRANVDGRFLLPMYGFAQSFNISVAAALCFSIIHRQRRENPGRRGDMGGDLSEAEKLNLQAHYYLRTLDSAEQILFSYFH